MPAKWFICPDGGTIPFQDCLDKGCRLNCRCLSKRTLRAIAQQREWAGEPTTTQLLKGSREAYLEITQDYGINPRAELFRVLGSKAHAYLEEFTDNELTEERLRDNIASGQFDFYDPTEEALFDTKTWGSYKVGRALGYVSESIDVPTGEVYKTGARKGEPKYKKQAVIIQDKPDMPDTEIQLNHYRMMLEHAGFPVKKMFVEAIVRDGGTHIARKRGIDQNGYLIPVKRLPNDDVIQYLSQKRDELIWALETDSIPPPCTAEERWEGRKCKDYCRVAEYCDIGQEIKGGTDSGDTSEESD